MATGLINAAYLFCDPQDELEVAKSVIQAEGVDFAVYLSEDEVIYVIDRQGTARIEIGPIASTNTQINFKYVPENGDPLLLKPIIKAMRAANHVDSNGFALDRTWFEYTKAHIYPDALYRLWRAFHGSFYFSPNVLVSFEDGYHYSAKFLNMVIKFKGTHGSLLNTSTYGFFMSTETPVPEYTRAKNIVEYVEKYGIGGPQNRLVP